MGLDMYAFSTKRKNIKDGDTAPVGFKLNDGLTDNDVVQIAYWRKHPDLHGWMQQLAVEKGFDPDPRRFNCVSLALTGEDIARLEEAVLSGKLPETSGFFFGRSAPSDKADDLAFITEAKRIMAADPEVVIFYDSWW